jgi:phosphosulfolactate synthase (CoM biosynthesis protein A)
MTMSSVADLTVEELKELIRETVSQTIVEMLGDPDKEMELRDNVKERLERSLAAVQAGAKTVPAHQVATRLGLEW